MKANTLFYNHLASFAKRGYIDWKQPQKNKVAVGDIMYIFLAPEHNKIMVKAIVEKIDLEPEEATDDLEFWINLDKYEEGKEGLYMRVKKLDVVNNDYLNYNTLILNGMDKNLKFLNKITDDYLIDYIDQFFNVE